MDHFHIQDHDCETDHDPDEDINQDQKEISKYSEKIRRLVFEASVYSGAEIKRSLKVLA